MKWSVANRRCAVWKMQHFEGESAEFTLILKGNSDNDGPTDGDGLLFHFYINLVKISIFN
jgi:hypothetical protein